MAERRQLSITAVVERPTVALCAGKDCRKRCEFPKLRKNLEQHCDVIDLKCIGLCNGPVVVTDPDTQSPAIYSKLRSKQHRSLVVDLLTGDEGAHTQLAPRKVNKKKTITAARRQLKHRSSA